MEIVTILIFLVLLKFVIRNTRTYKIVLAIILMLAAVPAGIFLEIGANGCCGAPSTGHEGIGFVLMAALFVAGLALLSYTLMTSKK
jgi:hypothetical protein